MGDLLGYGGIKKRPGYIPVLKEWRQPYVRIARHQGGTKREPNGLRSKK